MSLNKAEFDTTDKPLTENEYLSFIPAAVPLALQRQLPPLTLDPAAVKELVNNSSSSMFTNPNLQKPGDSIRNQPLPDPLFNLLQTP